MTFSLMNAKAVTDESTTEKYYDIYTDTYIEKIKQLNIEKINADLDKIYENKKSQYPYYMTIISSQTTDGTGYGIYTFFFENNTDFFYSILLSYSSYYPRFYSPMDKEYYRFNDFYCKIDGSCSSWNSGDYDSSDGSDTNGYYFWRSNGLIKLNDNALINENNGLNDFRIYDTNITNYVRNLPIDVKVADKYYQSNDRIPTVREYLKSEAEPTVTLSSTDTMFNDQNIAVQSKITAEWSIKDFSKYKYRFREINDTEWKYFFESGSTDEILVNKNGAYVFEIIDLNDNYVYGSSITITNLSEELPSLKIDNYVSPACFYNDTQKICDIVTVYSDNADFSKYTLQYKLDDSDWITHNYENSVKGQIMIYKNTTVTARLIRNIDNKLVDSASYTVSSIDSEISIDKPTFNFEKTFCRNLTPEIGHELGHGNYKETLKMTIYGLDLTKHKIYYSIDNANNFVELTELQDDQIPIIKHYMFEYYQDTKLIIKITDLDGNYITGMAYTLHFTCNDVDFIDEAVNNIQDVDDMFIVVRKFSSKIKNIMLKIKEVIEYFFNSLNSEIKMLILTAFILIIVLNLIMRMMK